MAYNATLTENIESTIVAVTMTGVAQQALTATVIIISAFILLNNRGLVRVMS